MLQYPDVNGEIEDWSEVTAEVHRLGAQVTVASDLLALTMLKVRVSPFRLEQRSGALTRRGNGSTASWRVGSGHGRRKLG